MEMSASSKNNGAFLKKLAVLSLPPLLLVQMALSIPVAVKADCGDCPKKDADKESRREGFNQPMILAGIKSIKLAVGELEDSLKAQGASSENLMAKMKEELSTTHATIVEDAEGCCKTKAGKSSEIPPILYLKVRSLSDEKNSVYSVDISLVEKTRVSRNHKDIMAAVWHKDLISKSSGKLADDLAEQVTMLMKDFKKDYLLANSADISHPEMLDEQGKKNHPFKKNK